MRKMYKILLFMVIILLLLSGCDNAPTQTADPKSTEPTIAILLYRADDVYISLVTEYLEKGLSEEFKVLIKDGQGDQSTQNEQFRSMLQQGVDVILLNPVEPQSSSRLVNQAKKADVPIFFFNREPDLDTLKSYSKVAFVGTTVKAAGILQGDIISEIWKQNPEFDRNSDGKFQFIMFQGEPDNPEALARTEYSIKQARELGVKMQQVGQTHVCNWSQELAYKSMKLALANGIQNIELIVANNDTMALGAIEALQELGFNLENNSKDKIIPVVGVDAIPAAVDAIERGVMSATVKQDGEAMANALVALTINAYEKRDFLEGTDYLWDDSGVAMRIPYSKFDLN